MVWTRNLLRWKGRTELRDAEQEGRTELKSWQMNEWQMFTSRGGSALGEQAGFAHAMRKCEKWKVPLSDFIL